MKSGELILRRNFLNDRHDSSSASPHRNGMATREISNPNRQLNSWRSCKQHHCSKTPEVHGPPPPLVTLPRSSSPNPCLLGSRHCQLGRLLHQTLRPHPPRKPTNNIRWPPPKRMNKRPTGSTTRNFFLSNMLFLLADAGETRYPTFAEQLKMAFGWDGGFPQRQ